MTSDQKLDRLVEDISSIKVDLSAMKKDVAHHIKRSDLTDENLKLLRDDVKPLQKHAAMVEGALKLIGIASLIAGIVLAIFQIIKG